jgi:hypothetical protein
MIIGETKYWIIISASLVIFVASIYPAINFYDQDLIVYRILFRFAGTIGGIFVFSVALLSIAKSMRMIRRESNSYGSSSSSSSSSMSTPP